VRSAARTTGGQWPTTGRGRRFLIAGCLAVVAAQAACTSNTPSTAPARLLDCGASGTFAYASPPDTDPNQTSLDVSTPAPSDGDDGCAGRPLVVWVHGGGWTSGDKGEYMTDKVTLFNGAGYVFASINYRLTDPALWPPSPQYPVHDADSAAAVAWLVDHADQLGIDPDRVAVLGHSAGGGITAAIATDERFLAAHDLPLTTITCAGSMDGEGYDVTAGATTAPEGWRTTYTNAFGTDPAVWAEASPINHVAPDKGIARFFIAARGVDWRVDQHLAFIDALHGADVPVTALDSRALEHADLTTVIGSPDDHLVTPALMDFLGGCFSA
jgi:acetyl esterase/lipase